MTPPLLIVVFVLLVDLLVLLGWSHDSRDGRDWQPRGVPPPDRSAVGSPDNRARSAAIFGGGGDASSWPHRADRLPPVAPDPQRRGSLRAAVGVHRQVRSSPLGR